MSFSDNFIKKPVLTTVCSILIVLVGVIAIPTLPIANLPNIADPLIQVTAVYGGANAEVTEQAVTDPIEQQINGVPGVAYISSTSDDFHAAALYLPGARAWRDLLTLSPRFRASAAWRKSFLSKPVAPPGGFASRNTILSLASLWLRSLS